MQAILDICCGLDVHKDSVVACIIKTSSNGAKDHQQDALEKEIRIFKPFLNELNELKLWLESQDCHHVAMESTGVYWFPVYEVLETTFDGNIEILVTNARHMRNVPGKKTDIKDSEWIATLLRAGLLRGSFIPPKDVRELRQLSRYRKNIVEDINTQKNRIEKSLQQAGFKLSTFLADIFGVSGRNLIAVLLKNGKLTPSDVDKSVKRISNAKKEDIKLSINGCLTTHQKQFLKLQLAHLDDLQSHLKSIEADIDKIIGQFNEELNRLITIPGIAQTAATAIIAEIGTDMSKFPTSEHFCSWAGLCPGNNESAGKKKVHGLHLAILI